MAQQVVVNVGLLFSRGMTTLEETGVVQAAAARYLWTLT